ncbi:MAG TPA: ABC transporter substrate-binding protein [Methyloceanibacter sp.]|jgi:putative tryptophan/tyrosine transport system substrate-binding protein|nr:ABC transporter substrate-binding protein [Methyloceanibacter sp.]
MGRGVLLALVLVLAAVGSAQAQTARSHRIGFLGNSTPALEANLIGPFRDGLRQLGYIEGVNSHVEYRWAEGDYARFPGLVAELVAAKVEVIVTAGTPAALAVKTTAPATPLVMVAVGDPVGTGLVQSLSRPGVNATGLSSIAPDMEGKRLQLLRELLPKLSRVGILRNPANPFHIGSSDQAREAAQAMGIKLEFIAARSTGELADAFGAIQKGRPDALVVFADRVFLHNRRRISDFALEQRLPTAVTHQELVESGSLLSFGANYPDMHRRAAAYVDKILKGAKAAELPIEQPTSFELVINLKTAKAFGMPIPAAVLLRANRVIE